jgi:hypothetical protein
MTYAVWLMCAGAALSVVSSAITASMAHRLTANVFAQAISPPSQTTPQISMRLMTEIFVGAVVLSAVVDVGLWLWMAWKNYQGKSWARVVSTVFFGVFCLSTISSVTRVSSVGLGFLIPSLLMFAVGLAAVIMIWQPQAGRYYEAVNAQTAFERGKAGPPGGYGAGYGGYGYGGYGYSAYGYGSPQSAYGHVPPTPPSDQPPQQPPPQQPPQD